MTGGLTKDWSTRIEDLLSVSKLSLLSFIVDEQPYAKRSSGIPPLCSQAWKSKPEGFSLRLVYGNLYGETRHGLTVRWREEEDQRQGNER
jgi:hypothetical protein